MYSVVNGSAVFGVDGIMICVEADVNDGLPMFSMVGYLSSSVKEAGERVRTALKNSGVYLPPKRITINLSPADIKKDGSGFDLPIAVAIMLATGLKNVVDLDKTVVIGELSLNGRVNPVNGILPMVDHCLKNGIKRCIVPYMNAKEAMLVPNIEVIGVASLQEVLRYLETGDKNQANQNKEICKTTNLSKDIMQKEEEECVDFSDIQGQETLKRGMEIAAAGFHNVLMTGVAGAGKSMIAKRLPTILPELSRKESIEVTKIYSVSGGLKDTETLITKRPFRAPHHSISDKALVGGGGIPKPGEISLAHNGVLFLDELPEFNKNVLEVMRQPLEDKFITISRVNATYTFPADFMLIAAMNPCPCGCYPNLKKCKCTPNQIKRYQSKISAPLLDRIDINLEVKPVLYEQLFQNKKTENSSTIRERVVDARRRQQIRYKIEEIQFNSQLDGKMIDKYIPLNSDEKNYMIQTYKQFELSARSMHRILKVARTIADLADCEQIKIQHLQEALFYKNNGNLYGNLEVGEYV